MRCVTSFPPTTMTAASGRYPSGSAASCPTNAEVSDPTTASVRNRTGRPAARAMPLARRAPRVSRRCAAPKPAAIESPSSSSSTGGPGCFLRRHTRSASSACSPSGLPMRRRAIAAWRAMRVRSPTAPAPSNAIAEAAVTVTGRRMLR